MEVIVMSKNIDWDNLGFGYVETEYRYLTTYKAVSYTHLLSMPYIPVIYTQSLYQ